MRGLSGVIEPDYLGRIELFDEPAIQLEWHVHPGAPVSIAVDTYPGCKWEGHVDSVSAGSDSSFSALPAENASGNWVKVVQRIPVRIAIDKSECARPLRAGMSAVITIDTGKRRLTRLLEGF